MQSSVGSVVRIIFPNQLYEAFGLQSDERCVVLVEEHLFFNQFRFHRRKLAFHRASMQYYRQFLLERGMSVRYISCTEELSDIRKLIPQLSAEGVRLVRFENPVDDWLNRRLESACLQSGMGFERLVSSQFVNSPDELAAFFTPGRKYFQTDFYIHQRKSRSVLTDESGKPLHGKWSFDAENRKRYPKGQRPPAIRSAVRLSFHEEAEQYVKAHFPNHPGSLTGEWEYPVTHRQAEEWLDDFLQQRFSGFGEYEDALVMGQSVLHHAVLTPMLNSGLLLPGQVLDRILNFSASNGIPMNDLEGFVRQVLGWREFVRAVYEREGRFQRTRNFWGFTRKMPSSFYSGTTGITPLDSVISGVLSNAYNHHIERLMVIGNFMLLCEIRPDDVYRWFMELYIDAYDWVMVPNVYGMSQFADGGLMCTKPYISGSNYILKMSDFRADGSWTETWDALFWRFMDQHRDFFSQNPRLGMLLRTLDRMDAAKRRDLMNRAEDFLDRL